MTRSAAALLALTTATLLPMCGTAFASAPDQISSGHQVLSLMAENDTPTGPGYVFLVQRTGSNTAYLEASLTSISQSGPNTIESSRMVMTQISSTVLSVAPQYASATVSSVSVPVTSRTCSYPTADVFAERTCTETTDTETFSLAASAISDLNRQAGSYVTDSSSGKTIRAGMSATRGLSVDASLGGNPWHAIDDGFVTGMAFIGIGVSNNVERWDW